MKSKATDKDFSNQSQNSPENGNVKETTGEEDKTEHKACNVCDNCRCSEKKDKKKQADETHSSQ